MGCEVTESIRYRVTNIYLGTENKTPILVNRKFNSEREAKRVVKALRREKAFRKREMRIISQLYYREMLRQRTFYPDYSKGIPSYLRSRPD